nr:MAG TPA: hypothetical protein [Caudoviricetes sp.]
MPPTLPPLYTLPLTIIGLYIPTGVLFLTIAYVLAVNSLFKPILACFRLFSILLEFAISFFNSSSTLILMLKLILTPPF